MGTGAIFPILWISFYIYSYPSITLHDYKGALTPIRAYGSFVTSSLFCIGYILLFYIFNTTTYAWTITAGLLLGPALALPSFVLSFPNLLKTNVKETPSATDSTLYSKLEARKHAISSFAISNLYAGCAILSLIGWITLCRIGIQELPTDLESLSRIFWYDAHPVIIASILDFLGVYTGLLFYILHRTGIVCTIITILLLLPVLGPGTSVSLVLYWIERNHANIQWDRWDRYIHKSKNLM